MVEARVLTVGELLQQTAHFSVPPYQRRYQWGEPQVRHLWADVAELVDARRAEASSTHLLGTIVLAPTPLPDAVAIVDGQQRLITLALLLAAIGDRLPEDAQVISLLPSPADRGVAGGAIVEADRLLRDELAGLADDTLQELADSIRTGLTVIVVRTEPGDDVHRIFRSLNTSGVPLRPGDQIRNHTFMRLPDSGAEAHLRYWEPLEKKLTTPQIEHLVWLDLARDHPAADPADIVELQQKRLDALSSTDDVEADLARFTGLAEPYLLMLHPGTEPHPDVRQHLIRLNQWDSDDADALVLELLRLRVEGSATDVELASALHVVESFLVRRLLINRLPGNLGRLFREAVAGVAGEGGVDERVLKWFSTGRRHFITDEEVRRTAADTSLPPLLRSWFREEEAEPTLEAALRVWAGPAISDGVGSRIRRILAALPAGRWTSHRDLAEAVGASTQTVVNEIAAQSPPNTHRILRDRGDTHPECAEQPALLEAEGVTFNDAGYADPGARLTVEELHRME